MNFVKREPSAATFITLLVVPVIYATSFSIYEAREMGQDGGDTIAACGAGDS